MTGEEVLKTYRTRSRIVLHRREGVIANRFQYLGMDLTDWKITRTEEFPGFSHDKITEEVYCR